MLRQHLVPRALQGERHFRWRGGDISRIEGLSDAVFAFALTLIVVSLQVPRTFDELAAAFRQIPAFAVCFTLLVMCWYYHYQYHRRYGFEDFVTNILNAVLLFVILFYVYPLKFLFTVLINQLLGIRNVVVGADGTMVPVIRGDQMRTLMFFYSGGIVAIFGLFALFYARAWRRRDEMGLDEAEREITRAAMSAHLISAGIGALSLLLAMMGGALVPASGLIYFLMPVAHTAHGLWRGRRLEHVVAGQARQT